MIKFNPFLAVTLPTKRYYNKMAAKSGPRLLPVETKPKMAEKSPVFLLMVTGQIESAAVRTNNVPRLT